MDINESWLQIGSLFLANAGLILWFRAESRSDWRHMDNKIDAFKLETSENIKAIQEDMKDFHTKMATQDLEFKMRLCAIEEKRHGIIK